MQFALARFRPDIRSNELVPHLLLIARPQLRSLRAAAVVVAFLSALAASHSSAQTVTANVNVNSTLAVMPEYGLGIHASVYDNSLRTSGSPFNQLDPLLDAAGVNTLRYPGGGYADVFHFSHSRPGLGSANGYGLSPWWGGSPSATYGYMGPSTDFGNFVRLLDATNSHAVITLNTSSAMKFDTPSKLGVPTHNGQPQEAAAWVAYANADAAIYKTPNDIDLGVDAEGNDWKTAGYWARLRASTASEFQTWATADGIYDSRNSFLAIDRDAPVGIKYWEIGNENFGTGYYGGTPGQTGYALNYAAPYNGSARDDNPLLSPAAYGQQILAFDAAMKIVDPTIKTGAVLATPPDDYSWSYADLNDNGSKQLNEPYWNDEVLSQVDPSLGKVADNVDFVIVHWYPGGNDTTILNHPRTTIPRMIQGTTAGIDTGSNAGLRDSIGTWRSDASPTALEIFVTETDGGGTNEAVDGLFAADMYATFFDHGVTNVDWLELHGGSFLSDANVPNFAYFGAQSVGLMADPGDNLVATSTSDANVRVHAAKRADGRVAVMLINMNATSGGTRTVNISINDNELSNVAYRYETNGDSPVALTFIENAGSSFSTSIAGRTLLLFVIDPLPPLPGDFNDDGVVDTADYTVWRDTNGTDENYLIWKDHFGDSRSNGGAGSDSLAVPEPGGFFLLLSGVICQIVAACRVRHD